ncbi:MAG: hypothetical protein Fur0039_18380 [Rhodocyclaceae bacterium]
MAAFITLTSAALFFGIDYFVTRHFRDLHRSRAEQVLVVVSRALGEEMLRMEGIAKLVADDADLRHATYYHLFLEGEREHPRLAVERIARAFRLDSLTLWDARGRLIASAPGEAAPALRDATGAAGPNRVLWSGARAWIVAGEPLMRDDAVIARVQLARSLDALLGAIAQREQARLRKAVAGEAPAGVLRVALPGAGAAPAFLDVELPDTAGAALAQAKRLLAVILGVSGAMLMAALAWAVRWQLAPVRALARAAAAVGRGEFGHRLQARGSNEVAHLVRSFNAMTEDLAKLRRLEQRLRHQERLSAIGRVAARVAHDINNPLTVIRNVAELMRREVGEASPLAPDLALIGHHSERCTRIVQQLLAYGRPVRINAVALDLVQACREIAACWQAGSQRPLCFEPAETSVRVLGDRHQLEQMLSNLLDNARDACPEGGISVAVSRSGGEACIRILDEGPGFSPEAMERVFEPFFTTKTGGTGLGLASSLAIAQAHGGRIEIGGEGAGEVAVWLPLHTP